MTAINAEGDLLTIGAVLSLLREEFPDIDITISKIRFLEAEGLVVPARTPTGYRKFSPAHVDRLRYTLRMQRDHFLPLRVIREQLEKLDQGIEVVDVRERRDAMTATSAAPAPAGASAASEKIEVPAELTIGELAEQTGLSMGDLHDLDKIKVIQRLEGSDKFAADALPSARIAADLKAHGLEPRHLRPIVSTANSQVDLIQRLIEPRLLASRTDEDEAALRAEAYEIAKLGLRLQNVLTRGRLSRSL